ncbi:MAG: response regulator transcription factor [Chloroflexi bacterium]|nr:response regulator transcription factor [Chloroflexota bacterium]
MPLRDGQRGETSPAHILIVDDDLVTRKFVAFLLSEAGYQPIPVESTSAAQRVVAHDDIHLIILDVGLPKPNMNGLEFCRRLREERITIPVLFLSGHDDTEDRLAGFAAGGDDYLRKPFEPRELISRVRALLGRRNWGNHTGAPSVLRVGDLELSLTELIVKMGSGRQAQLTPTEMRVLQCLMANAGRVVTRDVIINEAWGYDYQTGSNQVEVYVRRIRRKIEEAGRPPFIETVRGLGYRFLTPKQLAQFVADRKHVHVSPPPDERQREHDIV